MNKLITVFLIIPTILSGQNLKVSCGNDTTFCASLYLDTTIHLGTQVKIANGTAPFTYKWSCQAYSVGAYNYTAKDFLNDTNLLTPYFKDRPLGSDRLYFNLAVTDKNNNIASDSIIIRFSQFSYFIGSASINMNLGDSIQFGDITITGGIEPLSFYWTPSLGLSDSSETHPWCMPVKSTDYSLHALDSVGCKSEPNLVYQITLVNTLVEPISASHRGKLHSHQAGSKLVFDNPKSLLAHILIYSIEGKKQLDIISRESSIEVSEKMFQEGIYLYLIDMMDYYETGRFLDFKFIQK